MKLLTRIFFIILITPALSYAAGPAGMYTDDEGITESDTPTYEKNQGSVNLTQEEKNTKTTITPATTNPPAAEETVEKEKFLEKVGNTITDGFSAVRNKISNIKDNSAQNRIERKAKNAINKIDKFCKKNPSTDNCTQENKHEAIEKIDTAQTQSIKELDKPNATKVVSKFETQLKEILTENDFKQVADEVEEEDNKVVENTENNNTEPEKELTKEQQLAKVAELQENYDNMKEIENSFENRMLGATGMATMGIGGMQLATAMTEDRADDAAEQQMKAYLATFSCTYANGKRFSGGETAIELPGGNELINLYSEYVGLANDLKTRKEALNLRPGIEAQPILDSATSGLYDDIATGKTSGTFTSLARALSDPNGADAAAWAAQREETAKQKKTALTTIGVGAVATVAGNLLINRNNEKERIAEILKKYEDLKKELTKISTELNNLPSQGCPDGSEGNPCKCKDENSVFIEGKGCMSCGEDKKPGDNGKCVCLDDDKEPDESGNCVDTCEIKDPKLKAADSCACITNASKDDTNTCQCNLGYTEENGSCVSSTKNLNTTMTEFSTDNAFRIGSSELTQEAKEAISKQSATIEEALKSYTGQEFCLQIIGHTDRTGFKSCRGDTNCNKKENQKLSKQRAETVLEKLNITNKNNVIAIGKGQEECDERNHPNDNDGKCRKITFELTEQACNPIPNN